MVVKAKPCFLGDCVARLHKMASGSGDEEAVLQFGTVLRAPKRYGRIFNANSELSEKDIIWNKHLLPVSLPPSNGVFLLERPVMKGSLIKHKGRIGEVVDVDTRATVMSADGKWIISAVRPEELTETSVLLGTLYKGVAVLLDNHLGVIESVTQQISFRLPDGNSGYFCVVQGENPVQFVLGDQLVLTEEQLRSTIWDTHGFIAPSDYDFSVPATVFRVQAIAVHISWETDVPTDEVVTPMPPSMIEPDTMKRLQIFCNPQYRIREHLNSQFENSLLLVTISPTHKVEQSGSWRLNFFSELVLGDGGGITKTPVIPLEQQQQRKLIEIGVKIVVKPLFLQSWLHIQWRDQGPDNTVLNSVEVDEVIAGREGAFVAREKSDHNETSYGIVYHCTPEEISRRSDKIVNVLWFVDLKNDRLDHAVRVLRLQQEEISVKDLVILKEMQHLISPVSIIMRRRKEDDFIAGQPLGLTSDGRIEIMGFDGKIYVRWPTLLSPGLSRVRTSLTAAEGISQDDINMEDLDWYDIYFDAMADLEDERKFNCTNLVEAD